MTAKKGLEGLRAPFPAHLIGKLPKPTKKQTDIVRQDSRQGIRCELCQAWHHPDVVHLDYVGHAALTDRLLDVDPEWNWSPVGSEVPVLDGNNGMWIKLTVCGVSRLGYGSAGDKKGGDATKEVIGDALRNAAMRFGAALDLWHKGDLHLHHETDETEEQPEPQAPPLKLYTNQEFQNLFGAWKQLIEMGKQSVDSILKGMAENHRAMTPEQRQQLMNVKGVNAA
jgi:hypothetical protein